MKEAKPNIIIIMADDMGYSDIGCFGSEIKTPHIDSLAENGVRFTQMYNCARCCPTRASLLTGLYPHQAGIGHMIGDLQLPAYQGYLRDDCVTIAEALKPAGYRTLMSGKWHVGGDYDPRYTDAWTPGDAKHPIPTQRGFDRFWGVLDGAMSFYTPHYLMENDERVYPENSDFYMTEEITNHAVNMIDESVELEQPFFLYVAHVAPHWPLHARPDDIATYQGRYRHIGWDGLRTRRHEEMRGMGLIDRTWDISPRDESAPDWLNLSSERQDWEDLRMAVYAAQVDSMDQGIGRILETLRRHEIEDNTIVMFLSDNGGCAEFLEEDGWAKFYPTTTLDGKPVQLGNVPDIEPGSAETFMSYDLPWANVSNAPFRKYKRWTHEGGISTPLVVQWTAQINQSKIEHAPCHVIDLLPTCLDAAGVNYPSTYNEHDIQPVAGESLLPAILEGGWVRDEPLYFEHQGSSALRTAEWKIVRGYGGDWELYNMVDDRTERHDLRDKNRPQATHLIKEYGAWAEKMGVEDWDFLNPRFQALYGGGLD